MKKHKIFLAVFAGVLILSFSLFAFAAPGTPGTNVTKPESVQKADLEKDPVKVLEDLKIKIQQKQKDGKISKEKAEEITSKINTRINDLKEFEKLSPDQKKDKLIKDFNRHMDDKVKKGRVEQDKAEKVKKEFKTKIEKWDGKGYPYKEFKRFKEHHKGDLKNFHTFNNNKIKNVLDKAVENGKITDQQRQYILENLKNIKDKNN